MTLCGKSLTCESGRTEICKYGWAGAGRGCSAAAWTGNVSTWACLSFSCPPSPPPKKSMIPPREKLWGDANNASSNRNDKPFSRGTLPTKKERVRKGTNCWMT